jgi:hypothetical protein
MLDPKQQEYYFKFLMYHLIKIGYQMRSIEDIQEFKQAMEFGEFIAVATNSGKYPYFLFKITDKSKKEVKFSHVNKYNSSKEFINIHLANELRKEKINQVLE